VKRDRRIATTRGHEDGFSLVEVLATMTILVVVLAATLITLDTFTRSMDANQRRNDTQQQSRTALDQMVRQLRNLAGPTPGRPEAVDKAAAYDLVFQAVDPGGANSGSNTANVRRVRYCLDTSDPSSGTVWTQVQTWITAATPAVPPTVSCPDPDPRWVSRRVAATNVVNRLDGGDRPIWSYDASATPDISFVRAKLYVDRDPGRGAREATLETGVFLRNQNRAPAAAFTATPTGNRHVLLNGSPSQDPEGQPLTYAWYDGSTQVGSGITYDYLAPAAGDRTLTLTVTDPGGLQADAPALTVTV
jgi:prepilin-type N-terminal cleavage/methylation domain-containing protein